MNLTSNESQDSWLLAVDGAARGNPGPAGCGAVIYDEHGLVVRERNRYLGHATNNVAEYEALLMGLEALVAMNINRINVQSDSELLVRQINGQYRVKNKKLLPLFARVRELLRGFEHFRIVHVRREANQLADRLANKAIDDAIQRNKSRAKVD